MTETVVAIAGSRMYPKLDDVTNFVNSLPEGTIVSAGLAAGVDKAARKAANERGLPVNEAPMVALMVGGEPAHDVAVFKGATQARIFWDGKSQGTKGMIAIAQKFDIPTKVVTRDPEDAE